MTLAALMLAVAGIALAHPEHDGGTDAEDGGHDLHQHGDGVGHLPATDENVDVAPNSRAPGDPSGPPFRAPHPSGARVPVGQVLRPTAVVHWRRDALPPKNGRLA